MHLYRNEHIKYTYTNTDIYANICTHEYTRTHTCTHIHEHTTYIHSFEGFFPHRITMNVEKDKKNFTLPFFCGHLESLKCAHVDLECSVATPYSVECLASLSLPRERLSVHSSLVPFICPTHLPSLIQ